MELLDAHSLTLLNGTVISLKVNKKLILFYLTILFGLGKRGDVCKLLNLCSLVVIPRER